MIGSATSSICSDPNTVVPLSQVFCFTAPEDSSSYWKM